MITIVYKKRISGTMFAMFLVRKKGITRRTGMGTYRNKGDQTFREDIGDILKEEDDLDVHTDDKWDEKIDLLLAKSKALEEANRKIQFMILAMRRLREVEEGDSN